MTYSFDIFDTCLIRACGYPESVFDILAENVLGLGCSNALYADFSAERREGEARARAFLINDKKEDITLEDIYDFCDFSLYTNQSKVTIMDTELEIEKKMLCPVKSVLEKITTLHNNNVNVCFISDMYLPSGFIKSILQTYDLFVDGDYLFLSCEIGKTKETGNLYKYIHDKLKIDYRKWEHIGDNKKSDSVIPQKLGIKTKLVNHHLSYYEKLLVKRDIYFNKGYLSRVANISKTIRYLLGDTPHISFAADFVAPIYVPFVYNILNDADQRGIKNLFFLARDAYIFYTIANSFTHLFPQIGLHYLYVSRKSLYLPGLTDFSVESINNLFLIKRKITLDKILDILQMSDYQLPDAVKGMSDTDLCIGLLLEDPAFISKLRQKQEEQKDLCIRYFEECGLTSPHSAIVDLAGTRKCHEIINKLLTESGFNSVFGYYLEVLNSRTKGNNYDALYFYDRYLINERHPNPIFPQELFEQYFSITDHFRTASYASKANRVVPVFEIDPVNIDFKRIVSSINQKVCTLFASYYMAMINSEHEYICRNALETYSDFYREPIHYYIKAFEGLVFSDSTEDVKPVLEKQSFIKALMNWKKFKWGRVHLIYNCPYPNMLLKILQVFSFIKNLKHANFDLHTNI